MAVDFELLWARVKANHDLLEACPKHRFEGWTPVHELRADIGAAVRCERCGGVMAKLHARVYVLGYIAAGGNPNDVWPGWNSPAP